MFGPEAGHVEETDISMGWLLLMGLRYALFTRPLVYPHLGDKVDPERDPVIISPEEDTVGAGEHTDLFGWGVFVLADVDESIRDLARLTFSRIWLGCTH